MKDLDQRRRLTRWLYVNTILVSKKIILTKNAKMSILIRGYYPLAFACFRFNSSSIFSSLRFFAFQALMSSSSSSSSGYNGWLESSGCIPSGWSISTCYANSASVFNICSYFYLSWYLLKYIISVKVYTFSREWCYSSRFLYPTLSKIIENLNKRLRMKITLSKHQEQWLIQS